MECFRQIIVISCIILLVNGALDRSKFRPHRQAPFCVDDFNEDPEDPALVNFADIFKFHREGNYVPVSNGITSPTGMITKIELNGIEIDDKDSGYKDTLRNWVHFSLTSAVSLEGLYVQGISAPWGIPFGEFITDFDCQDCTSKTSFLGPVTDIVPCTYRAALDYVHPTALVIGGKRLSRRRDLRKFKEAHFNFRFIQYPGVDHTYSQFLIVAVRNFGENGSRFETFFTPVYKMGIDDNPVGSYYPFYGGWSAKYINCHAVGLGDSMQPLNLDPRWKLRYDKDFDKCLQTQTEKTWYTCAPGPIQLKDPGEVPKDLNDWKNLRKGYHIKKHNTDGLTSEVAAKLKEGAEEGGLAFCADSGTWNWTIGKMEWNKPPELNLAEGSDDLKAISEEDMIPASEFSTEDVDCEAYLKNPNEYMEHPNLAEIKVACKPEAEIIIVPICKEVHTSDCDNLDDIPAPKFAKYPNGSRKVKPWDNMTFSEQFDDLAWQWGEKYVLLLHGYLLIFSVTVGFNLLAYAARYLKEDTTINPRSSFYGIGNWLWIHMIVTYIAIGPGICGFCLLAFQNYKATQNESAHINGPRDLCNVRNTLEKTQYCLTTIGHRYSGGFCVLLFMLSYVSAWNRSQSAGFRVTGVVYHVACGYLSKILGLASITFISNSMKKSTIIYILLIEIYSLVLYACSEVVVWMIDKKDGVKGRKRFPVIEAIEIFQVPEECVKVKKIMFPIYAAGQIILFTMMVVQHYYKIHNDFVFY